MMRLDRSNYKNGSSFADTQLGGERVTVETDEGGNIVAALADDNPFCSHPIDNRFAWWSQDYRSRVGR